jgi:hypothetical protein
MSRITDNIVWIMLLGAVFVCPAYAQGSGGDAPGSAPFLWYGPKSDSAAVMEFLQRGVQEPIDNMLILRPPDSVHYTMIIIDPKCGNIDNMPILGFRKNERRSYEYRSVVPDTARRSPPEPIVPSPRSRAPKRIPREK